uniref:(northern house mosquito) hypothetical protein n=1 Tax=Culex pipiens TaxID=7175 RepID=A0A8D8CAN6_CULPI
MLLLLLLAVLCSLGNALDCTVCTSELSWQDCESTGNVTACTVADVNALHQETSDVNPNLAQGGPEDGFQCFAIHMGIINISIYSMGCTFKKTQFCSGWPSGMGVFECRTFNDGNGLGSTGFVGIIALVFAIINLKV